MKDMIDTLDKQYQEDAMSEERKSQFLLYQTSDGKPCLEVRLEDETVWLTQSQMAELFQTTKQNVSLHIKNILVEKELSEESVVKEFLTTAETKEKSLIPALEHRNSGPGRTDTLLCPALFLR